MLKKIDQFRSDHDDKIQTALRAYELGTRAAEVYRTVRGRYVQHKHRNDITLTFEPEAGALFEQARRWVADHTTNVKKWALFWEWAGDKRNIYRAIPEGETYTCHFAGYTYIATMGRMQHGQDEDGDAFATGASLTVVCSSPEAEQVLIEHLGEAITPGRTNDIFHHRATGNGAWNASHLRHRALDTIILKEGQKEALVADLDEFLANRELYAKYGVPYHRGYLIYGPPGTGKSSLVHALATKYRHSIYTVSLSDVSNDAAFERLVSGVDRVGFLLIEDIDRFGRTGVSASALFNALDGIGTPDGLITILTTNHPDRLDPTLLRPGRIDYRLNLSLLNDEQLGNMYEAVVGRKGDLPSIKDAQISPAAVIGAIKTTLHKPSGLHDAFLDVIEKGKAGLLVSDFVGGEDEEHDGEVVDIPHDPFDDFLSPTSPQAARLSPTSPQAARIRAGLRRF
jgi:hypothetical protein